MTIHEGRIDFGATSVFKITETEIRHWADKHHARSSLPILIRRSIRETTDGIEYMRFPGNEAVDLAGSDGELKTTTGSIWAPRGHSFWESGCDQVPKTKADSDYKSSLKKVDKDTRASATFVFVTPRRWPGKDEWVAQRKSENDWSEIRVFDAIDLEAWLEETIATSKWLSELLGKSSEGLVSPDEWWQQWSTASTPAISKTLVSSRRVDHAPKLLEKLRSNEPVISVTGDDHSEAVAYVLCALDDAEATDILDRIVVATKGGASLPLGERARLIVISDLPDGEDIYIPDRRRTTIVRTYARGRSDISEGMKLSHVPSDDFRRELQSMGLSEELARRLAHETGYSVPVLRRQLSKDPEVRRPIWARNRGEVRQLLPFALVGVWSAGEQLSDITALALLGDTSESEIVDAEKRLLELEDAPLVKYQSGSLIVSRIDSLFAIGPYLETSDLDRFFELAPALISERDPALDLPSDQRWMANVIGKSRDYSGGFLRGLGDTLCLLSIYGNGMCGDRLGIDIESRVEFMVRGLLTDVSAEGWLTLRNMLSALAEASPAAFLDCIEAELRRTDPTIVTILGVEDGGLNGDCLRTDLLWALESLAWHPEYFRRCATILFELRRFDHFMDDNWSNKPSSSADDIFRVYPPCSVIDVREKMEILGSLATTHRAAVLDQLIRLIPARSEGMVMVKTRPRWRDPQVDTPTIYNTDVAFVAQTASKLIGDLIPFNLSEFQQLLPVIDRIHPDDVERFTTDFERFCSKTDDDEAKAVLRNVLRQQSTRRAYLTKEENYEYLQLAFDRMEIASEPLLAINKHRWMFDQHYVEWSQLVLEEDKKDLSWQERDQRVRERRLHAIREIEAESGKECLLPFAISTGHADIVADVLIQPESSVENDVNWILCALDQDDESINAFLKAAFWNKRATINEVLSTLKDRISGPEFFRRIAVNLPGEKTGWVAAATLGTEAEDAYWASSNIRVWDETPDADAEFAARKLIAVGRPRSAFTAFHHFKAKLPSGVWVTILEDIAAGGEPDGQLPRSYDLGQVFNYLDSDDEISNDEILHLELPFVPMMCGHGFKDTERTLEIHRSMSRDPELFNQLLCWMYRRHDGASEPDLDDTDPDRLNYLHDIAYHAMEGWNIVPGIGEEGDIDEHVFAEWNDTALSIADHNGRINPAYSKLAVLYARYARHRNWDDWLPNPMLQLLDSPENEELRKCFHIAVHNARGITTRHPYAGGTQERNLSDGYKELAAKHSDAFPRVSELLKKIAKSYEREALQEDEHAVQGERWH